MKIRYGGDLQIGDFIMVANNNYTSFGWFCGTGSGTVQYYQFCVPGLRFKEFKDWETGSLNDHHWLKERFEKYGFSSKLFFKEYIYGGGIHFNGSRVVKITDPESIFTEQEDIENYRKSKEALISIKFPVK
jgi:hypothetical protein